MSFRRFLILCFLIVFSVLQLSCETAEGECKNAFTVVFKGNVKDGSNNPLGGVSVKAVVLSNSEGEIDVTDSSGNYSYSWSRNATLGEVYLVFSKAGFQDYTSSTERVGDNCKDVTLTTDVTLSP